MTPIDFSDSTKTDQTLKWYGWFIFIDRTHNWMYSFHSEQRTHYKHYFLCKTFSLIVGVNRILRISAPINSLYWQRETAIETALGPPSQPPLHQPPKKWFTYSNPSHHTKGFFFIKKCNLKLSLGRKTNEHWNIYQINFKSFK